jgi:hypothetical protein
MTARRFVPLLIVILTGCYESVPVGTLPPKAGSEVEVRLTDTGRSSLREVVGPGATSVRGHYQAGPTDSLRLSVLGVTRLNGQEDFWKGEPVGFSRSDIAVLSERRISKPKTGAVLALSAIAVGLVKLGFENVGNSSGTGQPPPAGQ